MVGSEGPYFSKGMPMDPLLTYGLSFRNPKKKNQPPELVFALRDTDLERVEDLLRTSRIIEAVDVPEYLKEFPSESWNEPMLALDRAKKPFGLGSCAYVVSNDDVSEIRFPFTAANLRRTSMTIHVVLIALSVRSSEVDEGRLSNRMQLCEIQTRCSTAWPYGHAVSGYIFPSFRKWLVGLTEERREEVCVKAAAAIQATWYALHGKGHDGRKMSRDFGIRASISEDGRFYLKCPGDACDLSIYPDGMWSDDPQHSCDFSCHNLDSAPQQLSLLSGLAVLMACALEDIE